MDIIVYLIFIVAFIGSVILHEIAHGAVANYFGDNTAKIAGRLSLNPLVHIDPIGSILVPMILIVSQAGFIFGWAKPVPINPFHLKGGKASYRWVTMAGIATNFILAIVAAIILKVTTQYLGFTSNNLGIMFFFALMQVNVVLAVFNSMPLPGFDGFNFLATFKPVSQLISKTPLANPLFMARYGLMISILLLFLFLPLIGRVFNFIFSLFYTIFGI